ncbi:hypothetical protein E2C01_095319 [Portunus trituberculatus]|uniref:Uncharacterized protein n=1 Tax=Portunus trituberculatus TaxID=210409 RepID=A0A5B7K5G5_PORTR|nr:hypothetical protein [Portunus trituberculatus]
MMGYELRIVSVPYFPYMNYQRVDGQHPEIPVQALDSIDYRILQNMAKKLNFTYVF